MKDDVRFVPAEIELVAIERQERVRSKAGLKSNWSKTPERMKEWYRFLVLREL